MAVPTLDGSANNIMSGGSVATLTLTTTLPNDIIVVDIAAEAGATTPAVASVTASGLTFSRRNVGIFNTGTTTSRIERWWAAATAALSAAVVTVTFAASIDDSTICAYGVNGCINLTNPWDAGSQFNNVNDGSSTLPSILGWTTASSNDLLLLAFCSATSTNTSGTVTGFTNIVNRVNGGGARWCWLSSWYLSAALPQTGVNAQYSVATNYWSAVADTLIGVGGTLPPAMPQIDGQTNPTTMSGATSTVLTLTTTQPNDVVVVDISYDLLGSPTVTSVAATGLTFTRRSSNTTTASNCRVERWWARAASPLSAVNITITFSASMDDSVCVAFGVAGAGNPAAPWDGSTVTNSGAGGNPSVSGWTTSGRGALLLAFGNGTYPPVAINGSVGGFNAISNAIDQQASYSAWLGSFYQLAPAARTSLAAQYSLSVTQNWVALADAISGVPAAIATARQTAVTINSG